MLFFKFLICIHPGWALLEGSRSPDRSSLCFFIPECHTSGSSNVFGFLQSQKEAKRFRDASTPEATASFQTHASQSWWRTLCLSPISIIYQWRTCRVAPAAVAPAAQDTHPLQPVCTMVLHRWAHRASYTTAELESFPSSLQHITFFATNHNSERSRLLELDRVKREDSTEASEPSMRGGMTPK